MKKITLIELLITIVVITLLTGIAMYNIIDVKTNAENSKDAANLDAMTKSVLLYHSKEDTFPTHTIPELGNPAFLDLEKIYPKYLTKLPSLNYHYYVDESGNVSTANVKYPELVKYDDVSDIFTFEQSTDFESYIISASVDGVIAKTDYNFFMPDLLASQKSSIIKITEIQSKKYVTNQEIENFNSFVLSKLNEKYPSINAEDIGDFYIQGVDKYGNITPLIGENFNPYTNQRTENKNITRFELDDSPSSNLQKSDMVISENIAPLYTQNVKVSFTQNNIINENDIIGLLTAKLTGEITTELKGDIKKSVVESFVGSYKADVVESFFDAEDTVSDVNEFLSAVNTLSNLVKDLDMTGKGMSDAKLNSMGQTAMALVEDLIGVPKQTYDTKEVATSNISSTISTEARTKLSNQYDKEYRKAKNALEKYMDVPNYKNLTKYVYTLSRSLILSGDKAYLDGQFDHFNTINSIEVDYKDGSFIIVNGYDDMNMIDKFNDKFINENSFNIPNLFRVEVLTGEPRIIFNEAVNIPSGYTVYVSNSKNEVKKQLLGGYENEPLKLNLSNHLKNDVYTDFTQEVDNYLIASNTLYYTITDGKDTIEISDWNVLNKYSGNDYQTMLEADFIEEDGKLYYMVSGYLGDYLTSPSAAILFDFNEIASDQTADYVYEMRSGSDEYLKILIDDYVSGQAYNKQALKYSFKIINGFNQTKFNNNEVCYSDMYTPWIEDAFPEISIEPASSIDFTITAAMTGYGPLEQIITGVPITYSIYGYEGYQNVEWQGNLTQFDSPGNYIVKARILTIDGIWSDWKEKQITVSSERTDKYDYKDNYLSAPLAYGSVYVMPNGSLRLYGDNTRNALGIGHMSAITDGGYVDVSLPDGEKAKNVFTSSYTTLIASESGKLFGFGKNDSYSIVNSTITTIMQPVLIFDPSSLGAKVTKAQTTGSFTLMLLDNGDLYFRGVNTNKIAGDNTTTFKDFVKLSISNLDDFDMNGQFVVAINKNDEVFAWGRNYNDVFGNSGVTYTPSPIKIMDDGWIVKAGNATMLILKKSGDVVASGATRVTIGLSDYSLSDAINGLGIKAKYIEAGTNNVFVISADGKLYTFGLNAYGQLAHGAYNTGGTQNVSASMITAKMVGSNKAGTIQNLTNYTDRQRALASDIVFEDVKFISKETYMGKVTAHTNSGYVFASGYNGTKNYLGLYTMTELDNFYTYGGTRNTPSIINVFVPVQGLSD